MTTICSICARGGSQGVPRKNIRPLLGKPLIVHTIEQALSCRAIDRVFVSTDDAEIAEVAAAAGAEVPFLRPAELATSSAAKIPVIEHLVAQVEAMGVAVSRIIDLDPTSPLREVADIEAAAALLDDETDCVITGYPAEKNPYFNMVERDADGNIGLVKRLPGGVTSRQAAPRVWSMNASIYVWHRHSLTAGLWNGRTRLYEMPHERSVDIDSEIDFRLVEMLMTEARRKGAEA
ncbi:MULTISPECIES: acylneuraminate cytidylyltransferase family protein [unclassified Paracoccus (in: a-proteobacteria)]|uniref:acylneuraminate cytidylyltransferase family protein n=1 Tax=unclassified Paracoccus (in: a-proteobacteria) TaxID=2688777 RepID=UPI0012B2A8ED|nr:MULTISPECIES: acylneuraminate cytidylyltransferase family protein [unclassified Paracoccus (in: a-proteobacteria)]UXU74428.1 acylneuraminate cytidylyltransferase family protein [Paracoccus sp. SMMA_5]UXU80318.1 acylneuraminate cytidylyltransferase family protein [Paracoccus sp. SMMA_5_TC]